MTTPVNVTTHEDRTYTVVFNLPKGRTLASLPAPDDERVRLERRPRRRVAVLRYRGSRSGPRVAEKFSELLARVRVALRSFTEPCRLIQPWAERSTNASSSMMNASCENSGSSTLATLVLRRSA